MPDYSHILQTIGQIADLLLGDYKGSQYGRVLLPLIVLRRFDRVLAPSKAKVLTEYKNLKGKVTAPILDKRLNKITGEPFHNHSPLDLDILRGEPNQIEENLILYIEGFSKNVDDLFKLFKFEAEIRRMGELNLLYLIVSLICDIDLSPDSLSRDEMGIVFENIVRQINENYSEVIGEHGTPHDVSELMVGVLFSQSNELLAAPIEKKILDPFCGMAGMLMTALNYCQERHIKVKACGQDLNVDAIAIAKSAMLMNGSDSLDIRQADSFTQDQFNKKPTANFNYLLSQPPFGADWRRVRRKVQDEHIMQRFSGRFGAGVPRVSDGSLLFLQLMLSKFEPMEPEQNKYGSRLGIIFTGSPLFSGDAGTGESKIRRWIIENDWLETIIALPEQLYYNTGIGTFIWILTNRKETYRQGKIQLLDVRNCYKLMRRNIGSKYREIGGEQLQEILHNYTRFETSKISRIFNNKDFGYTQIVIERPLRLIFQITVENKARFLDAYPHLLDDIEAIDKEFGRGVQKDWNEVKEAAKELLARRNSKWKGSEWLLFRRIFTTTSPDGAPVWFSDRNKGYQPDPQLRDTENVPLNQDIDAYFKGKIQAHEPNSWMDGSKSKTGYEIHFNHHFFSFTPQRSLREIQEDLEQAEGELFQLRRESPPLIENNQTRTKLVDSEVALLGEIPAHWEVLQLRHLVDMVSGTSAALEPSGKIAVLRHGDIKDGEFNFSDIRYTNQIAPELLLQKDDLLYSRAGSYSQIGRVTRFYGWYDRPVSFAHYFGRMRCNKRILPGYLHLLLNSAYALAWIRSAGISSSSILSLSLKRYARLPLCLPPLEEQRRILEETTRALARLDKLHGVNQRINRLREEQRTVLISAATTGKFVGEY